MDPKAGILFKIAATLAFTVMSACVKGLNGTMPVGQVIFCRSLFALIPLYLWLWLSANRIQAPSAKNAFSLLLGSCAGLGGMFFGFLALVYLPLVNVTVLSYTTPLFTIVLAWLFLREHVRSYRWFAVLAGFSGIFVTLLPDLHDVFAEARAATAELDRSTMLGTVLALSGAICATISAISIRRLSRLEQPSCIVLSYTSTGLIAGIASAGLGWNMPDGRQMLLLVGVGFAGGLGQIAMTLSLRHAQASLLAPFEYTTMIWAVLLGYIWMSERPAPATLAGASIVIAAGLFTMWRERRVARRLAA